MRFWTLATATIVAVALCSATSGSASAQDGKDPTVRVPLEPGNPAGRLGLSWEDGVREMDRTRTPAEHKAALERTKRESSPSIFTPDGTAGD